MTERDPTVFIIEDDLTLCDSLGSLFKSVDLNVETYSSGTEYLNAYSSNRFGCLLIDIRLRDMSGLELQEKLAQRGCLIPFIFISGYSDLPLVVRAMKAGAKDFIPKPFDDHLLLERAQKVIRDTRAQQVTHQQFNKNLATLTPREHEVMLGVIAGKLNRTIADEMGISPSTTEQHRANMMRKMQVKSLAELITIYVTYPARGIM